MHPTKTLEEICEVIAREKQHAYMGGSNQFDFDAYLIAIIYDVDETYVEFLVKEKYLKIIGGK